MNRKRTLVASAWIGLAAMAGAVLAADTPSNRRESYSDRYGALSEHNIFMKERPVKPATKPSAKSATANKAPEESLVLRGIAYEREGFRAYIEDTANAKELKLSPGDAVGRGHITEVDIDSVSYERNGQETWIEVGSDFTGKQVVTVSETSEEGPTTGPVQTIDPNNPNLTLAEKMKLRRQQEMKK
jgi:hypothetical protein